MYVYIYIYILYIVSLLRNYLSRTSARICIILYCIIIIQVHTHTALYYIVLLLYKYTHTHTHTHTHIGETWIESVPVVDSGDNVDWGTGAFVLSFVSYIYIYIL